MKKPSWGFSGSVMLYSHLTQLAPAQPKACARQGFRCFKGRVAPFIILGQQGRVLRHFDGEFTLSGNRRLTQRGVHTLEGNAGGPAAMSGFGQEDGKGNTAPNGATDPTDGPRVARGFRGQQGSAISAPLGGCRPQLLWAGDRSGGR